MTNKTQKRKRTTHSPPLDSSSEFNANLRPQQGAAPKKRGRPSSKIIVDGSIATSSPEKIVLRKLMKTKPNEKKNEKKRKEFRALEEAAFQRGVASSTTGSSIALPKILDMFEV